MIARLALIAILVTQPGWLGGVVAGRSAPGCGMVACCEVVETTTCCGTRSVEVVCRSTGGACECASDNGDPRSPVPPATLVDASRMLLALLPGTDGLELDPTPEAARRGGPWSGRVGSFRSHNARQARLGVWRT